MDAVVDARAAEGDVGLAIHLRGIPILSVRPFRCVSEIASANKTMVRELPQVSPGHMCVRGKAVTWMSRGNTGECSETLARLACGWHV